MAENQALREHRFSAINPPKPHTQKHPNGYLTCKFKKWIKKQIYPYHNSATNITEIIKGVDGVALATIWAALQGDMRAVEILLERLEGKVSQKLIGEGFAGDTKIIFIYPPNWKPKDERIADTTEKLSS